MAVDGMFITLLANTPGFLLALAGSIVLFRATAPARATGYVRGSIRLMFRFSAAIMVFTLLIISWGRLSNGTRAAGTSLGLIPERTAAAPERPRGEGERPRLATAADSALHQRSASGEVPAERPRIAPDSLVLAYLASRERDDAQATSAIRAQLGASIAAEELQALRDELQQGDTRIASLRAELAEAQRERGILAFLSRLAGDLGLGFGWAGLYFTAFVALWNGRTPGKRLLSIRIIRLDGRPVGWWMAFERFGGYAASIATGLLGFAQIFWDRNRQGIHDKIAETVVVTQS
jgi:hypothetical protein